MKIFFIFFTCIILLCNCNKKCETKIIYFSNGKIKEKFTICDGKKEGEYVSYYLSGKLKSRANYDNNKLNGKLVFYYENGQKKQESTWINGKKNGFLKNYYHNGDLHELYQMKNNEATGLYEEYYNNGIKKEIGWLKKGEAFNRFYIYDNTGSIKEIRDYKIIKDRSLLNEWLYFNKDSIISKEKSSYIESKITDKDSLYIELISNDDFMDIVIGKFDKNFTINDPKSIDTIRNDKMSLKLKLKDDYIISKKYIRGIINAVKKNADGSLIAREIYYEDSIISNSNL